MFFIDIWTAPVILITSPHFLKDSVKKRGAEKMISYKKLWKVLIDKDLKKKDLITVAGVSSYTVNKLTHGDNVTTDVLQRICKALECDIGDIMEVLPD
jgi:DNA-binding Xre family transcriptional regulator